MGKALASLLVVFCASMGNQGARPNISFTPLPPHAGDTITITYTGTCPAKLKIELLPNGPTVDVAIGANGTGTYTVPDETALIISDPAGGASPVSSPIAP